ncbi:MAG TPA: SgcJ/EcaC family oxidoreductase [Stellaceae bacterium]
MTRGMLLAAALLLLAAPAPAQTVGQIQQLNDKWMAAFDKGDAAALAAMYAPDAYVLPAGAEMAKGRQAIEAFWQGATKQLGDAKLVTVDVLPLGRSAAREIGTFSFKTKAQPPQEVVGKYAVVWRKIGGRWLLATDIWNMNK